MVKELVWISCPLLSLFWQLGGYKWKSFRRFGYPLLVLVSVILFSRFSFVWLLVCLLCSLMTTLPHTLSGSSVKKNALTRVWPFIGGYLLGLPIILIKLNFFLPLIPGLTQAIVTEISNQNKLSFLMPWKLAEGLIGFSIMVPYCFVLGS